MVRVGFARGRAPAWKHSRFLGVYGGGGGRVCEVAPACPGDGRSDCVRWRSAVGKGGGGLLAVCTLERKKPRSALGSGKSRLPGQEQ
jgi:hypothetical protein